MNIIYNVCEKCGNQTDFIQYSNGVMACALCGTTAIKHNVEVKEEGEK